MPINKVLILKDAVNRQLEQNGFVTSTNVKIPLHFVLDNTNVENAFNIVQVSSLAEAKKIMNSIISVKLRDIDVNVEDYNKPLFLSVTVNFPM